MKKILFILSVVALVTVGCNKNRNAANGGAQAAGTSDSSGVAITSGDIAYINIDTLISHYAMYTDLRAAYEEKVKKAETEVNAKGRSLENGMRDYQNKVEKGLVTRAQAQTMEENLNKQQQSFLQHRDKVMGELGEEEQVLMNQIHYSIMEYVKAFNSDFRFKMILSTTSGGPVVNADPSLDITAVILEGINKEYASTNKAAKGSKDKEKLAIEKEKAEE